ncbi:very short patch repair endonuclease [Aeromonas hydrophila]|uniref:very short patch repair endonuclease n=1 Tax=Aeromonas hydrophila TaxID=644 RepID=UPI0029D7EA5C|nr:very short patch repair endonuclease [Aeromonas hydrophila]MDX7776583.1 very short patch repair endonuclease [Aeromonas hydrophila]
MTNDVLTPEQRHRCMSHSRSKNTGLELAFRHMCRAHGLRYRLKNKLFGRPDMVFPRQKVAVFIDGCFWHGCPLHYKAPGPRVEFWQAKLKRNRERDEEVTTLLQTEEWIILRYWEHDIKIIDQRNERIKGIKIILQDIR